MTISISDPIQELIDQRIDIKAQIETLTAKLKGIDEEIKTNCLPGEVLLGSSGMGYKLHKDQKFEYGPLAVKYLKERDLLEPFVKISTIALDKLRKENKLSYFDLDTLQAKAKIKETLVLREFIPEEAKVF